MIVAHIYSVRQAGLFYSRLNVYMGKCQKIIQAHLKSHLSFVCLGKQKTKFLDRLKTQQEDLQALKETYEDLHQKHAELSLQAKSHEQHIHEMEVCIQKHM